MAEQQQSFTPGDWFLATQLEPCGGCLSRSVMAQDTFIAEVLFDGEDDATAEANARLIAAAPALFEALAEMIRLADMGFEASMAEPEESGNYAAYNKAVAALASAQAAK